MSQSNKESILQPRIVFPDRWAPLTIHIGDCLRHSFGGPLALNFDKWPIGFPLPHRVVTLDLSDPVLSSESQTRVLPLIYAYQLSGCNLKYGLAEANDIVIFDISGKAATDWPYPDYPAQFPSRRLLLGDFQSIRWDYKGDQPWNTVQGSRPEQHEFLVIVPPSDAYGVSLWGRWGDREGVETIFRVNRKNLTVEAWNECS